MRKPVHDSWHLSAETLPVRVLAMQGPLDFIKSIQEAKKAQAQWASVSIDKRLELLMQLQSKVEAMPMAKELADSQGLPLDFVQEVEFISVPLATEKEAAGVAALPTGMIAILLPERLGLRFLLQKALPALLAGNGLFIKTSENNFLPGEIFKQVAKDLPPNLINIFYGDVELGNILASHPGVHAVVASGKASTIEKIIKASLPTFKKLQLHGDYHNSALILNEAPLTEVIAPLLRSAFTGHGMLKSNINNVLLTELRLAEFEEQLKAALDTADLIPVPDRHRPRVNELKARAKAENGKVIFDKPDGPLVIRDMSHCSTLQLDCLAAPILLISPVKYVHEMVKWTNTGSLGELAQIFGAEEKIQKFGAQLEVGNVVDASWISSRLLAPGSKQSFYGIADERPFGAFFSNLKSFSS
jgi:aminomuconate-semialdehyde/2-hydroxymuconate-6-semialdehyde dehydrogenase